MVANLTAKVATGGIGLVMASMPMLGMINQWEGRRYPVYLDIGNVPTVCEGHTGPDVKLGDIWTKEQCDAILVANATKYGRGVLECTKVAINQHQFDALTLFAINVGISGMCTSRAMREINKGNYVAGCRAIAYGPDGKPAWSYVGKKFVKGLHNRRLFESQLCMKPMPLPEPAKAIASMPPLLVPPPTVVPLGSTSTSPGLRVTR